MPTSVTYVTKEHFFSVEVAFGNLALTVVIKGWQPWGSQGGGEMWERVRVSAGLPWGLEVDGIDVGGGAGCVFLSWVLEWDQSAHSPIPGDRARGKRRGFSPATVARNSQEARVPADSCTKHLFFQFFPD